MRAEQKCSGFDIFLLCRNPCIRGESSCRPIQSSTATRCPSAARLPSFKHFNFSAVNRISKFSCSLFNHLSAQLPLSRCTVNIKEIVEVGPFVHCLVDAVISPTDLQELSVVLIRLAYQLCQNSSSYVFCPRTFSPPFPSSLLFSFSLIPALCTGSISALRSIRASTSMHSFPAYGPGLEASDPFCVVCWGYEICNLLKSSCAHINCRCRVNAEGSW